MATYKDWTDHEWELIGLGDGGNNPWTLEILTPDILTFEGDGNGDVNADLARKNGTAKVANQVKYDYDSSGEDKAEAYHATGWYVIRRYAGTPTTMTCNARTSGGLAWTAVER